MSDQRRNNINKLINRVEELYASEKNQQKLSQKCKIQLQLEKPMADTIIFGYDFRDTLSDPEFFIEQALRNNLWAYENIDDDIPLTRSLDMGNKQLWIAFSLYDIYSTFDSRGIPKMESVNPFTKSHKFEDLKPVDFYTSGDMPEMFTFWEKLKEIADGRLDINFISYRHGPLDIAVELFGYEEFCLTALDDPELLHKVMGYITEQRNEWFTQRAKFLGKDLETAVLADDWINIPFVTPDMLREFLFPYYKKIIQHHNGLHYIHSCGNATDVQGDIAGLAKMNFMEISAWSDLEKSVEQISKDISLHIRFRPNDILFATEQEMENQIKHICEVCDGRDFMLRTTGVTPILNSIDDFKLQIDRWLNIAKKYMY